MEETGSKINVLREIMEIYGEDFKKVYEHNCKFEIINIEKSKDLTNQEKELIKDKVKDLEYYYQYVIDKTYVLVSSKKYDRKIISIILNLKYLEDEISCCVDYLISPQKAYLKELETIISKPENVFVVQEEKDNIKKYDIHICGKNTRTKKTKSRLYSYDRIKTEETGDNMLLVERFINKEGFLTTRNMINEHEWTITLEEAEELEKQDDKITEDEIAEYIYSKLKENIN